MRIEKENWLPNLFARVLDLSDVVSVAPPNFTALSKGEVSQIRNTQALPGDTVRVLGHHNDFSLVMKNDGAKGWMLRTWIHEDSSIKDFEAFKGDRQNAQEFLKKFEGVPYLWGGLSSAGIDCSGLTQLYFLSVHGELLPRNSRDQRKLSNEKPFEKVSNHDLVFGVGRRGGSHHCGVFVDRKIWHAYSDEGVVCHTPERFSEIFRIEAVGSIL